mgnify:CR=1 FL=1
MAEPVVSYPGAKWRFYPYMVDYFPTDMKTFVEPFFGGGSVSLSVADDNRFTKLERMIGGDLYTEMWAFWQGIKTNPDSVVEIATKMITEKCPHQQEVHNSGFHGETARKYLAGGEFENFENSDMFTEADKKNIKDKLALYNLACDEGKTFWNWAETVDTTQMTLEERAARMILVNKISFSGMGDAGSISKDQFCDFRLDKLNAVYDASRLLQRIEILNVSFEDTMKFAEESPSDSFIFLDPPYAKQESSGLYGKGGSTHKGFPHEHFAEFTKGMHAKWFMTYDDSVIVRKLFQGKTVLGDKVYMLPFKIPGGYTMAGKTAEDALDGEELFLANYNIIDGDDTLEDEEF